MSGGTIALIVLGVLTMDAVVVGALARVLTSNFWNPIAQRFPARAPEPGAVHRSFQSFSMGLFNLGLCVHVGVDGACCHLSPARLLRLGGAQPMSIPWDQMRITRRHAKSVTVRIGAAELRGPAWCLNLADPAGAPHSR